MEYKESAPDLSSHGVVAIVRNTAGEFLLLEDNRKGEMEGCWAPPHGRCDAEKDLNEQDGVIREVKEEVGLDVIPIRKVLTQPADTKVTTVAFWLVDVVASNEIVLAEEESSRYGWFSLSRSLELKLYPGTRTFFNKVFAGELSLD